MRRASSDGITPAVGGRNAAGGVLLGIGAPVLGQVACFVVLVSTAYVSTTHAAIHISDDSGDRAQARTAVAIVVIMLVEFALAETMLLAAVVTAAVVQLRRGRRHLGVSLLIGWVSAALIPALYVGSWWW